MTKRTDIHRPAAIVPANYRYVMSYALPTTSGGVLVRGFNVENTVALIRSTKFAKTGCLGKCSVCGANFINGDIFIHEPTGEHVHMGHECAAKYEFLMDRSEYELELGRHKAAAAVEILKAQNAEERQRFLNNHDGLEEALKVDHHIVKDIAHRFVQYRTLTDKQIELVFKLATEANKPAEDAEKLIPAPITAGRQSFVGIVVSAKSQESQYGTVNKMTVKVTTENGVWLAWGTIPAALLTDVPYDKDGRLSNLRGATVDITATLKPGRDAHFAIMSRPVGVVVKQSEQAQKYLTSSS